MEPIPPDDGDDDGPIERARLKRAEMIAWVDDHLEDIRVEFAHAFGDWPRHQRAEAFVASIVGATSQSPERPRIDPTDGPGSACLSLWRALRVWAREAGGRVDDWAIETIVARARRLIDEGRPAA